MLVKIHDHPCDGCFVKSLKGLIKETRYEADLSTNSLRYTGETLCREGLVTYMDNYLGYHKVGNGGNEPAITLHLYTPPYTKCKVSILIVFYICIHIYHLSFRVGLVGS